MVITDHGSALLYDYTVTPVTALSTSSTEVDCLAFISPCVKTSIETGTSFFYFARSDYDRLELYRLYLPGEGRSGEENI